MSKKIKDTTLSEIFGMTSATVGNYRRDDGKKRKLYDAMIEYYIKRISDDN